MLRMWWVNQGRAYRSDPENLEIVWAPYVNSQGRPQREWDRLEDIDLGDVIIHYAAKAIRGFSLASSRARPALRPADHDAGWDEKGRRVEVEFLPLHAPVGLEDIQRETRLQNESESPFDKKGDVKQGYLYPVFPKLQTELETLLEVNFSRSVENLESAKISVHGVTDKVGLARYRLEQPELRRVKLHGRSEAPCDLCGKRLPARYLVAAHIKKRAEATELERQDLNNVMLACQLGCDLAFELGHLIVNDQGVTEVVSVSTADLAEYLNGLKGRKLSIFRDESRKYFAARRRELAT